MADKKPSKSKKTTTSKPPAANVKKVKAKKPNPKKAIKVAAKKVGTSGKSFRQVCLSIYHPDLKRLDDLVSELKGVAPGVNRSSIIRYAVSKVDVKTAAAELAAG